VSDTSEQTWTFQDGQLAQPDGCLTVSDHRAILAKCAGDDTQRWNRTGDSQLHNIGTNTCLIPASNDRDTVTVAVVACST
jgi:ricin-type beta-trefoil lectin protein